MKLKRFPQKLLRKSLSRTTPSTRQPLATNPPDYSIGYCWFLYHTGRSWRWLPTFTKPTRAQMLSNSARLSRRWQGIISVLRVHLHVRTPHPHFDLAVASDAGLGRITQGVLVARVPDRPGVSALDVGLCQLGVHRASSSCVDVFRQDVAIAHQSTRLRQVDPLQLVVYRDGRAFASHRVDGDIMRPAHL